MHVVTISAPPIASSTVVADSKGLIHKKNDNNFVRKSGIGARAPIRLSRKYIMQTSFIVLIMLLRVAKPYE